MASEEGEVYEMQRLIADLKSGNYKQIYLLYGEEDYLRKQYRDKLREALVPEGDTMNYRYYSGKEVPVGEVIDFAETMPFFAERRVLVLEDTGLFQKGGEALAAYMESPAPTVNFVFVESEIDKRSKIYKAVSKNGAVIEFARQDENTLKRWVLSMLRKENKQISEATLNLFFQMTGADMCNIRSETEKLLCYCMNKDSITAKDVEEICAKQVTNQIFAMVDAIAAKQQKEALALYYDLLTLKEPPMRILFLIARQFHILLQVKELAMKGYHDRDIAEKVGLHGFIAGKYVRQASKFKASYLREAVESCVEAEEMVKTGRMDDQLSVEMIIVRYSAAS